MRAAYLHEVEDRDEEHRVVLTGSYTVVLDGGREGTPLGLAAALTFAGERAERVLVDVDGERYVAVGHSPGMAPLTEELVARASRRRRLPGQEWLDRTALDDPMPVGAEDPDA